MRTLDQVVHAIGPPRVLREVRVGPKMVAAVGRWRHGGAFIPLSSADAYQIIFNISGGHRVEFHAQSKSIVRQILPGSIGFNVPDPTAAVKIIGEADALQIFLVRDWIEDVSGCSGASSTLLHLANDPQFRSAAAQALVAIERRGPRCEVELLKIISAVVARFAQHAPLSTKYAKGGLSPGAHRRISKLIDDWLTAGTEIFAARRDDGLRGWPEHPSFHQEFSADNGTNSLCLLDVSSSSARYRAATSKRCQGRSNLRPHRLLLSRPFCQYLSPACGRDPRRLTRRSLGSGLTACQRIALFLDTAPQRPSPNLELQ